MTWAMDRYRDYMAEEGDDGLVRGHLYDSGYEYEDGYWFATFTNKVVVARKDHPKFGIVKGQKHRFIKTKYICDETGCSSWEVQRKALKTKVIETEFLPTPTWADSNPAWGTPNPNPWNTNAWNTNAWNTEEK